MSMDFDNYYNAQKVVCRDCGYKYDRGVMFLGLCPACCKERDEKGIPKSK